MGSSCCDDDENQFFDASEEIAVDSDPCSIYPEAILLNSASRIGRSDPNGFQFDVWVRTPESVDDRRSKFLNWFGSSVDNACGGDLVNSSDPDGEFDRVTWCSGAVLRSSSFDKEVCSSKSSMSFWSRDNSKTSSISSSMEDNPCHAGSCDGETLSIGAEHGDERIIDKNEKAGSGRASQLSPQVGEALDMESKSREWGNLTVPRKRVKKWWLKKFHSFSCITVDQGIARDLSSVPRSRIQRVKVRHSRKQCKELSALYLGQDIKAHEGSILAMKFSPDGQYLASAGEDGVVRLWQVVEDDRSSELDIPDIDPSCMYFTMNHLSELKPLATVKEKRSLKKTSYSACVIIPPKVFRLLEKPLHEFRGHQGEILDLSWSKNNHLLSSSVDNTVRLWHVGCDDCLKIFSHNNYVTCAQFNPVDDNYFISGSIDGKVRIWEISGGHVVNWADIKDIVTAVSYRPDGKGGIVGTLTGYCHLFNVSGNKLQLDSHICFHSKKKSSCKRITGFQYFPHDSNNVMVTCGDSWVRILHGTNLVGKYKGPRNAANYVSGSLTSDGKHIISACVEDSNVYVWNCIDHDNQDLSQVRKINSSERFPTNASVAIPWYGLQLQNRNDRNERQRFNTLFSKRILNSLSFSRSQDLFFLESNYPNPKGSATWPEEKLPCWDHVSETPSSWMGRAEYKFLKHSFLTSSSSSHAWGLVIITASWDGRIRSFINYGLPAR
ncbi:hypothetical protein Dimus_028158 [Dionaea muscipula]